MDMEELITFLKENLAIEVQQSTGNYGEKHCNIVLKLDGVIISEDYLQLD